MKSFTFLFLALVTLAALALFAPAHAKGAVQLTVTNCNNDTELRNKIVMLNDAQGGTLFFNCGKKTILLSNQLPLVEYEVAIDGGNNITLGGNDNVRMFQVDFGGLLTLKNIVLEHGHANNAQGGAIHSIGRLTLNHVTIKNSYAPLGGGAIYSNGNLDITNSTFMGNRANQGGAIYADGVTPVTKIRGSKFEDNRADNDKLGGAIFSAAAFEITTSEFVANKAGFGGAVYARRTYLNTSGSITSSTFTENTTLFDQETGLWRDNGIPVREFALDDLQPAGAALYVENLPVQVKQNRIQTNFSQQGGGIYVANEGSVEIVDSTFSGNQALVGGALSNYGSADVRSTTMLDNVALGGGGIQNHGSLSVTNVTFARNGSAIGSALYNELGIAFLTNVTMASNEFGDLRGPSIANPLDNQPQLALTNVLITNSSDTSNCQFEQAPAVSYNNLSSDDTCNFGVGQGNVDLKLGALANNGGYTLTFMPLPGSPAINGGTDINAPNVDQRGIARPIGGSFDVGAVEVDPSAPTPTRTHTPTATVQKPPTPTATHTATKTPPTGCTGKPSKPTLQKPKNGKVVKGPIAVLDWDDTVCAQRFKVVIKNGGSGGTRFQKKGGLLTSQFTTNPLGQGQTYAWRVIAFNAQGKTKSDWWTFKAK